MKGLRIAIDDAVLPVTVDTNGNFWAEWEGESHQSTTFKGLRKKMVGTVKKDATRVSIPALRRPYYDEKFEPVTLIGFHAGNGNVLYVDSMGKTQQDRSWGDRRTFYPVLTDAQQKELKDLERANREAMKAVDKWQRAHTLADKVLKDAVASARRDTGG